MPANLMRANGPHGRNAVRVTIYRGATLELMRMGHTNVSFDGCWAGGYGTDAAARRAVDARLDAVPFVRVGMNVYAPLDGRHHVVEYRQPNRRVA